MRKGGPRRRELAGNNLKYGVIEMVNIVKYDVFSSIGPFLSRFQAFLFSIFSTIFNHFKNLSTVRN
jgi:hypothetical protein